MPAFLDPHPTEEKTDVTPHILKNLEHLGIDLLIPIGGDDTLSYGERLSEEGFPVIGIPKTMDNDVFGTDYCIGFSTAITRSVNFIQSLGGVILENRIVALVVYFIQRFNSTLITYVAKYLNYSNSNFEILCVFKQCYERLNYWLANFHQRIRY